MQRSYARRVVHRETREVVAHVAHLHPVTDEVTYAVALHELGHCIAPLGFIPGYSESSALTILQEEAAWEWAEHYALDWTPAMAHIKHVTLELGYKARAAAQEAALRELRRQTAASTKWIKGLRL